MNELESLEKVSEQLIEGLSELRAREELLREAGVNASGTISVIIATCDELGRIGARMRLLIEGPKS